MHKEVLLKMCSSCLAVLAQSTLISVEIRMMVSESELCR